MIEFILDRWQMMLVLSTIALFWIWETALPFRRLSGKVKHDGRNLVIAAVNGALISLLFAGATVVAAGAARDNRWGIAPALGLSDLPLVAVSFIMLDLLVYWWHRMNHSLPLLWRFHRMHHSDPAMDVTTALRFHTGEIAISSVLRILLIPILGIPLEAIVLYDAVQLPVICFHHANIALPAWLDSAVRSVIVTPAMHKVHHSRIHQETDSNFSSVLSVWDRLFGSFLQRGRHQDIRFGLEGFDSEACQTIAGMLRTPFTAEADKHTGGVPS